MQVRGDTLRIYALGLGGSFINIKGVFLPILSLSSFFPNAGVFVLGNSVLRGIYLSKYLGTRQIPHSRENPFLK